MSEDIVGLCALAREGDQVASAKLLEAIYPELRKIAHYRLRRNNHLTLLDTTTLIHEMWLRLDAFTGLPLADRQYLLAYAARTMRSVVVDYVRKRKAEQNGGGLEKVELPDDLPHPAHEEAQLLRVHDALNELEKLDPRMAQVVELRYFAGLTEEETAQFLGIARRTVQRDWLKARALLFEALG